MESATNSPHDSKLVNNNDDNNSHMMSSMHYLPCNIHYDGSSEVNSFFQIKSLKSSNKLQSFFRGRELIGQELLLSDRNVIGINATQKQPESNTELNWEVTGNFNKITVWQHDVAPDLTHFEEALEWFEIANEVSFNQYIFSYTLLYNFQYTLILHSFMQYSF